MCFYNFLNFLTLQLYLLLGVRMLDGQATDALEASALGFKNNHIDIYINCWGPKDDGKTFGKPGPIATNALKEAAEKVRKPCYLTRVN